MKKIAISLIFILIVLILFIYSDENSTYKICLSHNLVITHVHSTIDTIGFYPNENTPLKKRLIRGKLKGYAVKGDYLFGYISTEFFKDDGLIGLEGEHDKEGYFIIDMSQKRVLKSGLSKDDYTNAIRNMLLIDEIPSLSGLSSFKRITCWF